MASPSLSSASTPTPRPRPRLTRRLTGRWCRFSTPAAGLLDQLGAAGAILQPQLFALWKDEIADRRAMFARLDPLTEASSEPATAPLDLAAVDQLTDAYERLYATADAAALLTPAVHVRMLGDAPRRALYR